MIKQSLSRNIGRAALVTAFITTTYGQTAQSKLGAQAQSRAWTKHEKDGLKFVTENASFDFAEILNSDRESYNYLLIRRLEHNEWTEGHEGIDGTITVTAWPANSHEDQKPLWTFKAPGNQGLARPGISMFQVSRMPCCSAPFQHIYYSLRNGHRLYISNGMPGTFGEDSGLLTIDGEYNGMGYTQTRYVAFGAIDGEEVPTVQYGTDTTIKQRLFLRGHEYGDNFDVPKIFVTEDGTKLANYLSVKGHFNATIVIQFDDVSEIRIPIEDDVVRPDKAILPTGYSLSTTR